MALHVARPFFNRVPSGCLVSFDLFFLPSHGDGASGFLPCLPAAASSTASAAPAAASSASVSMAQANFSCLSVWKTVEVISKASKVLDMTCAARGLRVWCPGRQNVNRSALCVHILAWHWKKFVKSTIQCPCLKLWLVAGLAVLLGLRVVELQRKACPGPELCGPLRARVRLHATPELILFPWQPLRVEMRTWRFLSQYLPLTCQKMQPLQPLTPARL